jgi:drug/metabolite transporter (DMT)-like permease
VIVPSRPRGGFSDALLAWFFVIVWGTGFIATKTGIQYAAPFTFLSLRFCLGIVCLIPVLLWVKPKWPPSFTAWLHVVVAGLLMHAIHLSGSHGGQYAANMKASRLAWWRLFSRRSPVFTHRSRR